MRLLPESIPFLIAIEPLLEGALRSTALIAIAWVVVGALRRAPASMRHLVWTFALLGCVSMPLAARVVPEWSLPPLPTLGIRAADPATGPAPATIADDAAAAPIEAAGPGSPATPAGATPPAAGAPAWRLDAAFALRWLPAAWVAGVAALLVRYLLAWAMLARIARRAAPVSDPAWQAALARHGVSLGLRRLPALSVSPRISVPIVCGMRRPTILLPLEAGAWPAARRDAVLLHELAHVRRFDLFTARLTHLAATLYWFNPLVWLAARRQRAEAERACDDHVLGAGGRPSAYASDLLQIARSAGGRERFGAAALAMARRSQLEGRLLAILDPRLRRGAAGRIAISVAVLATAAAIAAIASARPAQPPAPAAPTVEAPAPSPTPVPPDPVVLPAPSEAEPVAAASPEKKSRTTSSSRWNVVDKLRGDNHSSTWSHRDGHGSFRSRGTIRYSDALDDIVSISPGGHVEIEDRRHGTEHTVILRGRSDGIERTYRVDGSERPWDDEARAWFARYIVDLDRSSGMFADQRIPRLLSQGGPDRVLREISEMTSDYGRSVYFRKLFATPLDTPTMRRAVAQAGREIRSDYELAQTLISAAKHQALEDPATSAAYLEAMTSMESDYEHARVLLVLVKRPNLAPGLVEAAITSATRMNSDYEQARVMVTMAGQGHVKPPQQRGFIRGTRTLQSDYEKGRVLRALLKRRSLAYESIDEVLLASATMGSDYERANVLVALARSAPMDDAARAAFVESAEGLGSDYERGRALAALGRTFKR